MENYKSLLIDCLESKREIMANKEKYAKMFSEGRKSLEDLLLTCYEHDIMSQACCSGHTFIDDFCEDSYLYLKLKKKDLDIISDIIREYKKTNLKKMCDIEEDIQTYSGFKKYFGFCVRCDFDDADDVYAKLTEIINNSEHNNKVRLEYEVLGLLKSELLNFRKRKLPLYSRGKYEAGGITLAQTRGGDYYRKAGNYLDIYRTTSIAADDFISFDEPIDIEELTKYIYDHSDVDYTELVGRYKYESYRQLNDLKKVLVKNNRGYYEK